jgi:hypothetical protein
MQRTIQAVIAVGFNVIGFRLKLGMGASVLITTLFRPVGEKELELIHASGWRAFPPRLPEQPIFYPVLNEEYATQIARDWNTRDSGTGYVLRFQIESEYLLQFPVQTAGARVHQEYWIPAEELAEFNRHIVGTIEIVSEFGGKSI